jgi:hypothetical protein
MRTRIRWFGLGLVVIVLASMSVSLVAARSFPINPRDLQPGMREQGSWIFCVAGDHCHKILPIHPLFPGKDDPTDPGKLGTQAVSRSPRSQLRKLGVGGSADARSSPLVAPGGSWKGGDPGGVDGGVPLVNIQGGPGSLSSQVDQLEGGLRDAIHRLNNR